MTAMQPISVIFWFYLFSGTVTLSMAGIMWAAWYMRRDANAGTLSMLLLWLAVDMFAKMIMRSEQAIVTLEQVLFVSRMATVGMVTAGLWTMDTYLSSHNGHLSLLRRFVLWYRPDDDPVWERWRNDEHGN